MPLVTFQPSGKVIEVKPDTSLLEAAKQADLEISTPCGTNRTCGKCIVRIISGSVDPKNEGLLSKKAIHDGYVHACKTSVTQSPVTIEIPESLKKKGQFADTSKDMEHLSPDLLPKPWQINPLTNKFHIHVPEPQAESGLSDLDRLSQSIKKEWGNKKVIFSMEVIRRLANTLRSQNGSVTIAMTQTTDHYRVIDIEPGNQTEKSYGVAIDIGTTTISIQLVAFPEAETLNTLTDYNEQVKCGIDIISRINYAQQRPERLAELRDKVLKTINHLINKTVKLHNIDTQKIYNCVVSGNTTMTHLLLGLNPEYIRLEPYIPTILEAPLTMASDIGLDIYPHALTFISPAVGSYVGGDITAGLLCSEIASDTDDVYLFIDIGTNGELAIGNRDFIMACACSAGPAFEGGGIQFGMRASKGAIEDVTIDAETGLAIYKTIANAKAEGICGSGIISLVAGLFQTEWIDSSGKLDQTRPSKAIQINGRQASYIIVSEEESSFGKPISINETEIENIIRAKAAIYSACALMLSQVELGFEDLKSIYIAGGFGHFLNLDNAITIGLLPDLPQEKFQYIGNSSLMGSTMALISTDFQQKLLELSRRITYIDLSTDPGYMDQYTAALFLPHTDASLFPSFKKS